MFTVSPLALVGQVGLEPTETVRPVGLQPTAIAAMRLSLEARVGFEPTVTVLQTAALDHLAIAPGTPGRSRTYVPGFGVQSTHPALRCWLQGKDSNLRVLLQRQTAYH